MRTAALIAICLLFMVTGCAKQPAPKPVTPAPAAGESQQQPATPPAPVVAAPPSIESLLPVPAPLPEGLRRVSLPAGQPVDSVGLYFVDVAMGKLDGWLPPVREYGLPAINLWSSDDERWILGSDETAGYLIRRSDGAAFRYDKDQVQITVGPGVIVARPAAWQNGGADTNCVILDENVKVLSTFAINGRCTNQGQMLFSPDGKTLALIDFSEALSVWLVTAATGEVKTLGPFPAFDGALVTSHRAAVLRTTGDLVLELWLADNRDPAKSLGNLVRIYSWDGTLREERRIDGSGIIFSPDGKLVAYTQALGRLGTASVVQEWGAEQPKFRVAGGLGIQWLADSSGLVLGTFRGYRLVSGTGEMTTAQGPAGEAFHPFDWLIPSPGDANLFLGQGVLLDRSGKIRMEVRTADGKDLRITQPAWGPTAASLHFMALPHMGKGWEADFWFYIAPQVQRPPYPDKYALQVEDQAGECLNLRAEGAEGAKVVRCLPTGTKLALTLQENGEPEVLYEGQWVWLGVKTERGEQGFVAINTRSVAYAEK